MTFALICNGEMVNIVLTRLSPCQRPKLDFGAAKSLTKNVSTTLELPATITTVIYPIFTTFIISSLNRSSVAVMWFSQQPHWN